MDGDIKTVLRTMFDSPEFWSPEVYRAKVKTPLEFVVSAVRASDAEVTNAMPLVQALERLGMPLYGMQTPNGYSWMAEPWVNYGRSGEPDELCAGAEWMTASLACRRIGLRLLGEDGAAQSSSANRDSVAEKEKKLEAVARAAGERPD